MGDIFTDEIQGDNITDGPQDPDTTVDIFDRPGLPYQSNGHFTVCAWRTSEAEPAEERSGGEGLTVGEPLEVQKAQSAPVCQVTVVHEDVVSRLRPQVDRAGAVAPVFKALADETRAKIAYALSQAELCVCDVAALIGSSKAAASYHLRLLHHMGLATYRKEGKMVYYRLADPGIGDLIRQVLERRRDRAGR